MNDAQALFREGVLALRERKDTAEARRLLTESLRLDPQNEMAWLWLARTISDPQKRLQCVERALAINPANEQALAIKRQLNGGGQGVEPTNAEKKPDARASRTLSLNEEKRLRSMLKQADDLVETGDVEGAIEQWVRVLDIQVDHEIAMRNAVGYLSRLKYIDDARELVWRALDAGTQHPSIYLTAIDIAKHKGEIAEMESLSERLVRLPEADDGMIASIVDRLIQQGQEMRALEILSGVIEDHPKSQKLLTRMGDLHKMADHDAEALRFYDRAARLGTTTKEGREADKKLLEHVPTLTDRERGSLGLALREAGGFAVIFIVLAWHDAGLDLFNLGLERWLGVLLAFIGGYLLITATSSPQQMPLAKLLGGAVPEKVERSEDNEDSDSPIVADSELPMISDGLRFVLGFGGAALLVAAFVMVFSTGINLLVNPIPPTDIPSLDELLSGRWR
jgi:tetratricopeptide (TPR) repeat protein